MSHWASTAVAAMPLALVWGVVSSPFWAVGVAHTHGCTCGPANTGPPAGWLVTVSRATVTVWSAGHHGTTGWTRRPADSTVGPSVRPWTRPRSTWAAGSAVNAAVTSRSPARTTTRSGVTDAGRRTCTR